MKKSILILLLVVLSSLGCSANSADNIDSDQEQVKYPPIEIEPIAGLDSDFIRGMDVSMLNELEAKGAKFYDNRVEKDALKVLKDSGLNYVRLRLWNNPGNNGGGNCDLETVKKLAIRAKNLDMKVLLDFHYSDFWADPSTQSKPEEWQDLSFPALKEAVYDFTYQSLVELDKAGARPDMVQVGNELNNGLLWPTGKLWAENGEKIGGFDKFTELLASGLNATESFSDTQGTEIKTIVHLADGGDNELYRWFFDQLTQRGVNNFDVIGLSYYPYWHGTFADLKNNINDISQRYNKEVAVVETGYAFTLHNGDDTPNIVGPEQIDIVNQFDDNDYSATIQNQADIVRRVIKIVNEVPDNKGIGVFYWAGDWIPVEGAGWKEGAGNAWENQAMFDFAGNALPSLNVFNKVLDQK
ncbi:MAG: glycoside hydrolase family 53 protein [Bacillota bacterium]